MNEAKVENSLVSAVEMFANCSGLTGFDMDISEFSKIKNIQSMFSGTTRVSGTWEEKPSSLNCNGTNQDCFDVFSGDSTISCHNSWKIDSMSDLWCDTYFDN